MFKKERRKWDFLAKSWAAKCLNHVKQSRPCAKRSGVTWIAANGHRAQSALASQFKK
jgi:hypothetical protein